MRALLSAAALCAGATGCALLPPLLYWHSRTNAGTSSDGVTTGGTAWFDGARSGSYSRLPTSPLTNSNPLTAVEPLANVIPLTAVEPLANVIPLTAGDPLTAADPYRVLARSVQADTPVLVVEAVDLASGVLLKRRAGGADGRFEVRYLPPAGSRAVVIQATVLVGGRVTGYLCAPLSLAGGAGVKNVDLTFGTTALALSDALLAGVRADFDVATGFRKFKTAQLAGTVGLRDATVTTRAAAALDGSDALARVADAGKALSEATGAARALASSAADLIARATRGLDAFTAAGEAIMARLAEVKVQSGVSLTAAVADAASQVDVAAFQTRVAEVRVRREQAGTAEPAQASAPAEPSPSGASPTPASTPAPVAAPAPVATPGTAALAGKLIDAETRLPLTDRLVVAGAAQTTTDASGAFSLAQVPAGTASLKISKGTITHYSDTVALEAGKTRDLGTIAVERTHWFPQTSPVTTDLRHVNVISETFAYAAGPGGTLLRTLDGTSWATTSAGLTDGVDGIAIGAPGGVVVTPSGIYGTPDKGASWSLLTAALAGTALVVDGGDKTAFVVRPAAEGAGVKRASLNDLVVATPAGAGLDTGLLNLTLVASPGRVLYGTSTASVYSSADDGATWKKLATPPLEIPAAARHPVLAAAARILVAGSGQGSPGHGRAGIVVTSTDGGTTWLPYNSYSQSSGDADFHAVRARGDSFSAVGSCGVILSRVADSAFVRGRVANQASCGPRLLDVGFAPDLSVGWAVGEGGTIYKYLRDID
ncbi:MAG: hypothetical protein FJZ01_03155 [Candidatus Sericytochromatia bacterium]|nr:hypothetical protein [Candidatus Tanganyikabacteria bacterium]